MFTHLQPVLQSLLNTPDFPLVAVFVFALAVGATLALCSRQRLMRVNVSFHFKDE